MNEDRITGVLRPVMIFNPVSKIFFFQYKALPKLFGKINANQLLLGFVGREVELHKPTFFDFISDCFHALKLVVLFVFVNNNWWGLFGFLGLVS